MMMMMNDDEQHKANKMNKWNEWEGEISQVKCACQWRREGSH